MSDEQQEEIFIHFVSSIEDLNRAWGILKQIKRRKNNSLIHAAFQFALIEYSKPYLRSEGNLRKYYLESKYVPPEHMNLHNRILESRNKLLAHSDLTIKDAKLYVSNHLWGKLATISQNVLHGTQELDRIDEIIDLIEKTLRKMYGERDVLEGKLEVNFPTAR